MATIIKTNKLTKKYGKNIACDEVSINIEKGDIYGLIGRNGAGKTTLMKMISELIIPTSGSFEIQNDVGEKLKLGILIESPGLYLNLDAKKNLELKFAIEGIDSSGKIEPILELVGLSGVKKKVKGYSLGMKQRLGLAIALVGDPDILLLDEPTNGMDPQGMREFRDLVKRLVQERNLTVIISSHILEELSKIANRFGVIENGKLIKEFDNVEIEKSANSKIEIMVDELEKAKMIILESFENVNVEVFSDKLQVFGNIDSKDINKKLCENGLYLNHIVKVRENLENFYLDLTGGKNV